MIWYGSNNNSPRKHQSWNLYGRRFSIDEPSLTFMARGLGGDSFNHWHLETDGRPDRAPMTQTPKPPYTPLRMQDVRAVPLTGYTHVSTFSGTGGTCLGFRFAGFRTLWANDIDAHARHCYGLNFTTPIDGRDIRHVTAASILEATGLQVGALDVFEGSPPCTAFSTAGKRAKAWGQTKDHAGTVQHAVEDLFYEWLRLLDGLRPRMFVAENVTGLVKGVAKGYFKDILRQMKGLGYRASAGLLDAQWLGVPQKRGRLIFVGVREDLAADPIFPAPLAYRYSVRDALPWLTAARHDTGGANFPPQEFVDAPSPPITVGTQGANSNHYRVQSGANLHAWASADEPSPPIMAQNPTRIELQQGAKPRAWSSADEPAPTVMAQRVALVRAPAHDGLDLGATTAIGKRWSRLPVGGHDPERFDLVRTDPETPAPTILATGGQRGRMALTHPFERRKFTIAEVKRLCAFPDDFALDGPYAKQWARLGNSVPPLMAAAVARAVLEVLQTVDARDGPKRQKARPSRSAPSTGETMRSTATRAAPSATDAAPPAPPRRVPRSRPNTAAGRSRVRAR